jgi:hypothetical protein
VGTFVAIGHHGPVQVDNAKQMAEDAIAWITPRLADGTFTQLFAMAGGGRLVIAQAESEAALRVTLDSAPDLKREWQITELFDGVEALAAYVRSL